MEVGRTMVAGIRPHHVCRIVEASQPGSLRREVADLSRSMGLDDETLGRIAIVATELGTNLVKHTSLGGEVLYRPLMLGETSGIELVGIDRGPGMANPARMMEDGVSTAGSPGTGLGAIKRLSDEFALYSAQGVGTAILSRIWDRFPAEQVRRPSFEWGAVNLPKPGETVCGDGWSIVFVEDRALVMVADGLGHGPGAAGAAQEAVRAFTEIDRPSPVETMDRLHLRLRSSRGAAVAIAEISPREGTLTYAGIGNIFGRIIHPAEKMRSLVTMNGTLGHQLKKVQPFSYPWQPNSTLVMNSDGLLSNWDLTVYPGLETQHPALVAAMAYRDYNRGTDDLTVVAIRQLRRQMG